MVLCAAPSILQTLECPKLREVLVAPLLAGDNGVRRRAVSQLTFDCLDELLRPRARVDLLFCKLVIHWTEVSAVLGNAGLGVEVDCLERPHEEPAKAEAVGDRTINFVGAHNPVFDESKCFGEKRALKPVDDKAVDLAAQPDRRLSDLVASARLRDPTTLSISPRRWHDLDKRDEMRRVDRMHDKATRAVLEPFCVKAEAGRPEVELARMVSAATDAVQGFA